MEENKTLEQEELVKTVVEEYEKKIADLKKQHEEELKKVRDEEHEKSVQTIRAIMSGKTFENSENKNPAPEDKEISYEEQLIIDTRKNLGMKGEN